MEPVRYRLTVKDLADARIYAFGTILHVRLMRIAPVLLGAFCAVIAGYRALQGDWNAASGPAIGLLISLVWFAWMFVGTRWMLTHSARKEIAGDKAMQGDLVVVWDAERVTVTSGAGESHFGWRDFYKWQESSSALLLWNTKRTFTCLPKRVLTADQISDIAAKLTSALGPARSRRRA